MRLPGQKHQLFDKCVGQVKRWKTIPLWGIRLREFCKEIGCVIQNFDIAGEVWRSGSHDEESEQCEDRCEDELGVDPII